MSQKQENIKSSPARRKQQHQNTEEWEAVIGHAACGELTGMTHRCGNECLFNSFSCIPTGQWGKNVIFSPTTVISAALSSALRFPAVCSLTPLKATILVKSTAQQEAEKSFRGGESSCLLQMTVQGD